MRRRPGAVPAPQAAHCAAVPALRPAASALRLAALRRRRGVDVRGRVTVGRGVRVRLARGATLVLGDGAVLGPGLEVHVGAGGRLVVGPQAALGTGSRLLVGAGAGAELGACAALGDASRLEAAAGAVVLEAGARVGDHCALVARAGIVVEAGARLADDVAALDAQPSAEDVERPVRLQPRQAAPVRVGAGAVVGPGAALLPGVTVGARARVGARAVVAADVPAGATAGTW